MGVFVVGRDGCFLRCHDGSFLLLLLETGVLFVIRDGCFFFVIVRDGCLICYQRRVFFFCSQ